MPDPIYRIRDWEKHFENNRTRELKYMAWVPFPTKHDGDGFTELLGHKDGTAHFGAWCLIAQVAAKCDPRGTLLRDGRRPHDAASLARVTRGDERVFAAVLPRLVSIGWLEACDISQEGAIIPQVPALHGTELQDTEQDTLCAPDGARCPFDDVVRAWNEAAQRHGLPSVRSLNPDRRRLVDAFWRDAGRDSAVCAAAFEEAAACYGRMEGGKRFGLFNLALPKNRQKWITAGESVRHQGNGSDRPMSPAVQAWWERHKHEYS